MLNSKLMVITNSMSIGGSQKMVNFIVNNFAGVFSQIFLLTFKGNTTEYDFNKKVKLEQMNFSFDKVGKNGNLLSSITERIKWMYKIRRKTIKIKPDVIIAFNVDVIIVTKLSLLGSKAIFLASDRLDPYSYKPIWKILSKLIYPTCDGMIFQTEGALNYYGNRVHKKSIVIPNPYISENIEVMNIKTEKKIVSFGRLSEIKCFDVLIKAFSIVSKEFPEYRLVIYGDGDDRNRLEKLIKILELDGKVELPGFERDVINKVSNASVFVLSSRSEGMPNSLIEAMGAGLPVVATNCSPGGPAYLINHGVNGLLVPVGDVNAIAESILYLLRNPEYASELGKNAKKIKDTLSEDYIFELWLNFVMEKLK